MHNLIKNVHLMRIKLTSLWKNIIIRPPAITCSSFSGVGRPGTTSLESLPLWEY
uniref:Uncharacterized protein n=1 Tax=Amphimedon queenslandica TaxID=400682 RepID=A0A1X7VQ09_AMPQE